MLETNDPYEWAAESLRAADGLLIGAGAGIGVDSGLPDFRGNEGFWKAYPMFSSRKYSFTDMANPKWFELDPAQAWGFYGHRLNLYRRTTPHQGFQVLRACGNFPPHGAFVFTSNVDGQFQQAGFVDDRVVECHGSIHHLQCTAPCSDAIWSADGVEVQVDAERCVAIGPLPTCPRCGRLARPNIWMFEDDTWVAARTLTQQARYEVWLAELKGKRVVAIECGAGTAVPTVRHECTRRTRELIRINPQAADVPDGGIAIPDSALSATLRLASQLGLPIA